MLSHVIAEFIAAHAGVQYAGPGLTLRRFKPGHAHEYAFMTSSDA